MHVNHPSPRTAPEQVVLRQEEKQKEGEKKPSADSSLYGILNIKGGTLEQLQPSAAFIAELPLLTSSQVYFPCAFHMEAAH